VKKVVYRIVKSDSKIYPQNKVVKVEKIKKNGKEQEVEESVFKDEVLFEPTKYGKYEKPKTKIIRKTITDKGEELDEEPGKDITYKITKYGRVRNPQSKIVRRRTITKDGKDTVNEEDLPGDELIIKTINYGKEPKTQKLKKIIIKKDGKEKEIEEEVSTLI
jgi:hypothetical protein